MALAVAVAASACDDDDDALTAGAVEITLSPISLTLAAGASEDVTVNVVRTGAFDGDVTLEASGLPEGVTVQSATVSAAETSGTLTFVADATAADADTTVTVTASGGSIEDATAELSLTVGAGGGESGFQLALVEDSLEIAAGSSDSTLVAITRSGGFNEAVTFTIEGEPDGLTASLAEETVAGDTARITIETEATLTPDTTYVLVVIGSVDGLADQVDSLRVAIAAAAAPTAAAAVLPGVEGLDGLPAARAAASDAVRATGRFVDAAGVQPAARKKPRYAGMIQGVAGASY
jgi:uncharacterized membrane protein